MKYHLITFGCQMNKSDSERIASVLENWGHKKTSKINEADLIVVNMCSVRQSAVDRVFGLNRKLDNFKFKNSNLKTILTGCILKKDRKKLSEIFDHILNIKDLSDWPKILQTCIPVYRSKNRNNTTLHDYKKIKDNYLKVKPKYYDKFSAFVPISNGCNNFCSYCVVPYTRGKETYRPAEEILCEVKNLAEKGYKEIWLLGQNVNSYGVLHETDTKQNAKLTRKKINFPKLLKMVNDIPGDFKIRFTSPHPSNFSDELINVMANSKKVAKYLNLPIQSGDNQILKKMNRNYTVEDYKKLVRKIRKKMSDINLSTDVIVGFPGETKKQFENTAKLFRKVNFNMAYIAKYSPRPGTTAAKIKDNVPVQEKKRRERILREIISNNLK